LTIGAHAFELLCTPPERAAGGFTVGVTNEESNRNVALSFEPSCVRREGPGVACEWWEREGSRVNGMSGARLWPLEKRQLKLRCSARKHIPTNP